MKPKVFKIQGHNTKDKYFRITSPKGVEIELLVDFDDVCHHIVNREAKTIVKILNEYINEIKGISDEMQRRQDER